MVTFLNLITAANGYILPGMLGKTSQSGKRQAPCFSLTGRRNSKHDEDLQKVSDILLFFLITASVFVCCMIFLKFSNKSHNMTALINRSHS